jgi:hypothetical protein
MHSSMRSLAIMSLCLILAGCAAKGPVAEQQPTLAEPLVDTPIAASALVFSPPLAADVPAPSLSRVGREPVAYVGYEETNATYFYLRNDDRQWTTGSDGGWLERRAVSVTSGVRYR